MSVHTVSLINQLNKHILLRDPRPNDLVGQGLAGLWLIFLELNLETTPARLGEVGERSGGEFTELHRELVSRASQLL